MRIVGKNVEITNAMWEYATMKMYRLIRYPAIDNIDNAHMKVEIHPEHHKVSLTVPGIRHDFHAEAVATDYYAAVNEVIDKIKDQARREKTELYDSGKREQDDHFEPDEAEYDEDE